MNPKCGPLFMMSELLILFSQGNTYYVLQIWTFSAHQWALWLRLQRRKSFVSQDEQTESHLCMVGGLVEKEIREESVSIALEHAAWHLPNTFFSLRKPVLGSEHLELMTRTAQVKVSSC